MFDRRGYPYTDLRHVISCEPRICYKAREHMQHVLLCEPHLHRSQSVHSLSSSLPSFLISLAPSLCVMLTPCPPRRPSPLRGRNVFQPLSHSDFRCLLVLKSQHAELSPHVLVTLHPNALHEALCETEGILVSARATVDSSATPSEFLCRMLARAVASRCAVAWEYIHTRFGFRKRVLGMECN